MSDNGGIWQKILKLDRRVITTIAVLLLVIPLVNPIGLPIVINKYTKEVYAYVDSYPEDTIVLIDMAMGLSYFGAMGPPFIDILTHMMLNGFKIVVWSGLSPEAPIVFWKCWNMIPESVRDSYVYGEDYVYLGFMTGGESTMIKAAEDLHGLFSYDYYGTPLDQIPILENVRTHKDYDIVLYASSSEDYRGMMYRVWGETYDTNLILIAQRAVVPVNMIDAGLIVGYVRGLRGAAEYELLLNRPGPAIAQQDAVSLFFVWMLAIVAIGNFAYFMKRREEKR